jgi:hypothetical protein
LLFPNAPPAALPPGIHLRKSLSFNRFFSPQRHQGATQERIAPPTYLFDYPSSIFYSLALLSAIGLSFSCCLFMSQAR